VAGATPCAECVWPIIAGDCVTDRGLGGGPILSRGSGEMDSASEPSRLRGTARPLEDGRADLDRCASSTSSLTSLGGISADTVPFRRPFLTMGDCRTRSAALDERGALLLLLRRRRPVSGWATAVSPSISISTSTGDVPAELPDVVYWLAWACCCW
jgi:hypothetical protein